MAFGIAQIVGIVFSSLLTSVFAYLVLKLLKEEKSFIRVFMVVLISDVVMIFLPYISELGIPIPWYVYLGISIVVSLIIYKFGLELSWLHAIILMILTPIIVFAISLILTFLGLGTLLTLNFLA